MAQKTMYSGLVNSPETTITNNISTTDTIIYVLDPARVPNNLPNLMTLGTGTNAETIKVVAINDSALTVERGFEGIAKEWLAGTVIARNFTAYDHDTFKSNIEDLNNNKSDKSELDNFPFKIKSAFYTEMDAVISVLIASGSGETFSGNTINTITKTSDTTFNITSPSASTTYTIYLKNDGNFASSTDGTTATGSIIIGTVSTNADKSVNTIVDKRPLVSGVGKKVSEHLAETVTQIYNVESGFEGSIAAAITAALANGTGEVFVPSNEYEISSIMTIDLEGKHVKIVGAQGATFKATKGIGSPNREHMFQFINASAGITIEGITFDCNHAVSQGVWVQNASDDMSNVGDVIVTDCTFLNGEQTDDTFYYSAGLVVRGAFNRTIVTRCLFDNFISSKSSSPVNRGIQVTQDSEIVSWTKHTIVRDTEFRNVSNPTTADSDGLAVFAPQESTLVARESALTVEGCTFVNCKGRSIKSQVQHTMVIGNKFYRNAFAGNVEVDLQYGGGIISGNEFYSDGFAAMYGCGGSMYNTTLKGLVITGNRFTYVNVTSASAAVSVVANDASSVINGLSITDNKVIGEVQYFTSLRMAPNVKNRAVISGNSVTKLTTAFLYLWKNGSGTPKLYGTLTDNQHYGATVKPIAHEDQTTQLVGVNVMGNSGLSGARFNRIVITGANQGNEVVTVNIPLDYSRKGFKVRACMAYSSTDATIQAALYEAFVVMNSTAIQEFNKVETTSVNLGTWSVQFVAGALSFNVVKAAGSASSFCDWWVEVEGGGIYDA